ncbi:MAG: hypothetical protein B5M52_01205 [Helicobacteraceae bacterium 4484_230]|nr:MAG: hypothetical protein B5M52_01205 [Helicobacteraceae bacterium 4484_230]
MRLFALFISVVAIWVFSGCSTKEYYEPETVKAEWPVGKYLSAPIVDSTADGAVLEGGRIITKNGVEDFTLPEGYQYVGTSDNWIVASKINGDLLLTSVSDANRSEVFHLKKTIAAASVQDDIVAVLFASDDMALYSLSTKELLLKEQGNPPTAVDSRIVNPYFLGNLVLFLTLDGKIVIVNSDTKELLRSMIVSSEDHFNNIIYFNVIDNNMVAGTGNRLFALSGKERREPYELRDVIYNKEGIWISTKQGEVIALTPSLQLKTKTKFRFAHFLGMIVAKDNIYLLEKEGFLIVLKKDMQSFDVYEVDFEDGYVFVTDKGFYVNDELIDISNVQ